MNRILQHDQVQLDATKVEHYDHDVFGPITVFKDVVIARAIVQEYDDGKAYKPGKELHDAFWTAEGRWSIAGRHPDTYLIMNRDDIHGRTVNARPTKSLIDPVTQRPMDRGILVNLEVFDNRVLPQLLKDMVSGAKAEVSIGFSFDHDKTPGVVDDEDDKSIMGTEYDYVQRNISIDHVAFGLDSGRCPMPFCGVGADAIKVALDPFGGHASFEACVESIMKENPDYTREQAEGTCGEIEKRSKEKHKKDVDESINMESLNAKLDEVLSTLKPVETTVKPKTIEGDLSIEEINEKIKDLKNQRTELQGKIDELYAKREKRPEDELWNQVRDLDEEISAYLQARAMKLAADYPSSEYSLPTSCICRECGYTLQGPLGAEMGKHCTEYPCPNCDAQMFRRNSPESGEEIVERTDEDEEQEEEESEEEETEEEVDDGETEDSEEEVEADEPKKKTLSPDEVIAKLTRTLDDPDLKQVFKKLV